MATPWKEVRPEIRDAMVTKNPDSVSFRAYFKGEYPLICTYRVRWITPGRYAKDQRIRVRLTEHAKRGFDPFTLRPIEREYLLRRAKEIHGP